MHVVRKEQKRKSFNKQKGADDKAEFKCGKCGNSHKPKSCPAFGKSCNNCGKNNRFSKCCKATQTKEKVHAVEEEDDDMTLISSCFELFTFLYWSFNDVMLFYKGRLLLLRVSHRVCGRSRSAQTPRFLNIFQNNASMNNMSSLYALHSFNLTSLENTFVY